MKKSNILFAAGLIATVALTSCIRKNKNSPGFEYMPDMYRTQSYKAYENNPVFANGMTHQNPVEGTIHRAATRSAMVNVLPYPFSSLETGRDSAALFLKNPLEKNEANLAEGERLYNIYCVVCHGKKGMGDGSVVKVLKEKQNMGLAPDPYNSTNLKGISEGKIFHATQFGKNNMGPYAAQLNAEQRWKVVMFVQTLQTGESETPTDTIPK